MFTKTLIGAATAITIAFGSLTATATTASATNYNYGWNSGWSGGWNGGSNWNHGHHKKKICKPVYRKIKWWDYWGHPHWKKVQVGYKCEWVYPKWNRPHRKNNGWKPAY